MSRRYGTLLLACGQTLLLIALLQPAVTSTYALLDDYTLFTEPSFSHSSPTQSLYFREGRPLTGIFMYGALRFWPTVEGLSWIRGFAALGLTAFSLTLSHILHRRVGLGAFASVALSLAVSASPGLLVYVGWATAGPYTWGALLGLLGGWVASRKSFRRRDIAVSLLLVISALAIYQPTGATALIPAWFLAWFSASKEWRPCVRSMAIYALACLLYLTAFHLALAAAWIPSDRVARMGRATQIPGNLWDYLHRHLPYACRSWGGFLADSIWWGWAGIVALSLLLWAGYGLLANRAHRQTWLLSLTLLALILGSILGPLAHSGTNAPYRIMVVIVALLPAIPATVALLIVTKTLRWVAPTVAGVIALYMVCAASTGLTTGIVDPSRHEFAALQNGIRTLAADVHARPTGPFLVRKPAPPFTQGFKVYPVYEYGGYTSSGDFSWRPLAEYAIAEALALRADPSVRKPIAHWFLLSENLTGGPEPMVLDLASWMGASRLPPKSSVHSLSSSDSGWWLDYGSNWIWHESIGWAAVRNRTEDEWILESTAFGMLSWRPSGVEAPAYFHSLPNGTPLKQADLQSRQQALLKTSQATPR